MELMMVDKEYGCDNCGTELKNIYYHVMKRVGEVLILFRDTEVADHEHIATVCSRRCGTEYMNENNIVGRIDRV
jgi:hypothetical protein